MHSDFFLIEREGEAVERAERLAFGETSGRNEAWLRDTLFRHPEILPIRDIDPSFGPLVPLCTELRTEAGPLDIAFINPHGRLTLVECKLWRNPEARRKVVAQVLDYARAISRWTYADLQRQVSAATGKKGNTPYELVKQAHQDLSEQQFVDATHMAMRSGRFLLLIAGDGIREDVGALAELINRNAASGFSFGLVEVALYGLQDGGLVVQPRTLAKTQIIERTVVLVRDGEDLPLMLAGEPEADEAESIAEEVLDTGRAPSLFREWWAPIVGMHFDDPDQDPPKYYHPNTVRVQLPWQRVWLLAGASKAGTLSVCLVDGSPARDLTERLKQQWGEILNELPSGTETTHFATRKSADDFLDEDGRRQWLADTLNRYVNVLRPRIKDLVAQA